MPEISFMYKGFLLMLLAIPLLELYARRKRKKIREKRKLFMADRLFERLATYKEGKLPALKRVLSFLALAFVIIALARPQGGLVLEELEAKGVDIVFAIDVSSSMKAQDLLPENRLRATKIVVSRFIQRLKYDRVAIVGFAGESVIQCPLTLDYDAALTFLDSLDFSSVEKKGTDLGEALETSLDRFSDDEDIARIVVLLTDGEDHGGKVEQAIQRAKKMGVTVFTVGIGQREGALIPDGFTVFGDPIYKKHKGEYVRTRLDEKTLKEIAFATGGKYFHADSNETLDAIMTYINNSPKKAVRKTSTKHASDIFWPFLLVAFIFYILEAFIPDRIQREDITGIRTFTQKIFRKAAVLSFSVFVLLFCNSGAGKVYASIGSEIARGNRLFEKGDLDNAEAHYRRALIEEPEAPEINYNIGTTLYEKRDFHRAAIALEKVIQARKDWFEPHYNLGNVYFRLEDYRRAIELYEKALTLKPGDEDTKWNLELARKKLKEQEEKIKQQQVSEQQQKEQQQKDRQQEQQKQEQSGGEQDRKNKEEKKDSQQANQKEGEEKKNSGSDGEKKEKEEKASSLGQKEKKALEELKKQKFDRGQVEQYLRSLERDEGEVRDYIQRFRRQRERDPFNMTPEQWRKQVEREMGLGEEDEEEGFDW